SNGEVLGPTTGLNGLEFFTNFTGTAVVSGNTFRANTGNGIFIGSSASTIQVANNTFDSNFVGMTLDALVAPLSATIQGNTFTVPVGTPGTYVGILAFGSGVTSTIGGDGALGNTFENYTDGNFIHQMDSGGSPNRIVGCPNDTILANTFTRAGRPVAASVAILPC